MVAELVVLRSCHFRIVAMVEFKAMMEAITKLTEVVTGMQQREMTNVKPPGLECKKIDDRFMKVQEFDGRNDEWDSWSFSFKSSIRAQDKRAYELLVHAELETSEISENGLNAGDEMISGEVYNLLCKYCRGSAQSVLRTVEDCRGLVAWQKLHRVYNPMTVARTIQALGEVTRPPCVTDISLAEGAISKWEEMLKVERDFKQTIGDHMRIAILANFMPSVIKEYIYVNVQPDTQYKVIIDKEDTHQEQSDHRRGAHGHWSCSSRRAGLRKTNQKAAQENIMTLTLWGSEGGATIVVDGAILLENALQKDMAMEAKAMLAARQVEAKATVVSTHKAQVKARVARSSPARVSTVDKWATGNRNAGMSDE